MFEGRLSFGQLELEAGSSLTSPTSLRLEASNIIMYYISQITAESIHLVVNDLMVEGDARIEVSGRGPSAGMGTGAGTEISGVALGASHGGFGGGADIFNYTESKSMKDLNAQLLTENVT